VTLPRDESAEEKAGGVTCSENRTFSWRRCCSILLGLAILSAMEGGEDAMLTAELAGRGEGENGDAIGADATIFLSADQYRAAMKHNIRCSVAYCEIKVTGVIWTNSLVS
jgi:hypothetical protein